MVLSVPDQVCLPHIWLVKELFGEIKEIDEPHFRSTK